MAALKAQLEQRPQIQSLTRNPLLLTFLVILAGEEPLPELPAQRAEIYRRYVEELLDSWETQRYPQGGSKGAPHFKLGPLEGDSARRAAQAGFYNLGWYLHLAYYGGRGAKEQPNRKNLIKKISASLRGTGRVGSFPGELLRSRRGRTGFLAKSRCLGPLVY